MAKRILDTYVTGLAEPDEICFTALVDELCAVFALIQNEALLYARNKRPLVRERVMRVVNAFELTVKSRNLERLSGLWNYWNDLIDTSSPTYIGIDLPGSMLMEGYMVLEDFLELEKLVERATAATQ